MYPAGETRHRRPSQYGRAPFSSGGQRMDCTLRGLAAPRDPGAALYVALKTATGTPGLVLESGADISDPSEREWERQRTYWHCLTMFVFALERIEEYLVEGFNAPRNQHPGEHAQTIKDEHSKSIARLLNGDLSEPLMIGNKTVLVRLKMKNPPEIGIGRTCPWPTIETRVKEMVVSYDKIARGEIG